MYEWALFTYLDSLPTEVFRLKILGNNTFHIINLNGELIHIFECWKYKFVGRFKIHDLLSKKINIVCYLCFVMPFSV